MNKLEKQPDSWLRKPKFLFGIPVDALFMLSGFCACLVVIMETSYISELVYWPMVGCLWVGPLIFLRQKIRDDGLFWTVIKWQCLSGQCIRRKRWEAM